MGLLCRIRTLRFGISCIRRFRRLAAWQSSARAVGNSAWHQVGTRYLLCGRDSFNLEILFYCSHRFLRRDYRVSNRSSLRPPKAKLMLMIRANRSAAQALILDYAFIPNQS